MGVRAFVGAFTGMYSIMNFEVMFALELFPALSIRTCMHSRHPPLRDVLWVVFPLGIIEKT